MIRGRRFNATSFFVWVRKNLRYFVILSKKSEGREALWQDKGKSLTG